MFVMLETFADDMGSWKFMDVLGKPVMKLPDALVADLLTWRYLGNTIRGMSKKEDE